MRERRMFKYAPEFPDVVQCRSKTSSIVTWAIVLSTVTFEIDMSQISPKVTGRMSNNRMRTIVESSIFAFAPELYIGEF